MILGEWPNLLCVAGATFVMASVMGIAREEKKTEDGRENPYEDMS